MKQIDIFETEINPNELQVLQGVMCPVCNSIVYGDLVDNKLCSKCDWDSTSDLKPPEYKRCEQCED